MKVRSLQCSRLIGVTFASLLLIASDRLYAQLSTVSTAFTGSAIETFDEFNPGAVSVPLPIFSGLATISGPADYIWVNGAIGDPNVFYLGKLGGGSVTAQSYDGNQGFGMSVGQGSNVISFSTPVLEFGGFWASGVSGVNSRPPILFDFYDAFGNLIGYSDVVYSPPIQDGTLQWFGWKSSVPISRISYSGSFVVDDSLRIETVPEPSSAGLVFMGLTVFLFCYARRQPPGGSILNAGSRRRSGVIGQSDVG
jgi:hypothetical protein